MRASLFYFAFGLLAAMTGVSAAADPIDYDYLNARLELLMEHDDMMGLAVAVVENGQIRFVRGYGLPAG